VEPCPNCAEPMTVVAGHPRWCPACEWNIEAGHERIVDTRSERRRARDEGRADRIEGSVGADLPDPTLLSRLGALAVACAVHAVTLLLLLGAGAIAVSVWPSVFGLLAAGVLAVAGVTLRPRLGRRKDIAHARTRDDLPTLFSLLDDIAGQLDARPIAVVSVGFQFNASSRRIGLRREPTIQIGAQLWAVLGPQERVSVLAHEIAHEVNGDTARTVVISTAMTTLARWHDALRPGTLGQVRALRPVRGVNTGDRILMAGAWFVRQVSTALASLTRRGSIRAEYLADDLAARVAGTAAMVRTLDDFCLAPRIGERAAALATSSPETMWAELGDWTHAIPDAEHERLRRLAKLHGDRTDRTHPLNWRRIAAAQRADHPPSLVLEDARSAVIDDELADDFARAGRELANRLDGI
jgi:hypothetical protein